MYSSIIISKLISIICQTKIVVIIIIVINIHITVA